MKFTKMHGLGNDFVVLKGPLVIKSEIIAKLCERNFGIGADGLLVISPIDSGVKMEYWNADGSRAEMCGNGLRCAARFAVDNDMVEAGEFKVLTPVGPLKVSWDGQDENNISGQVGKVTVDSDPIEIEGSVFYRANVGNPHAISFVTDVGSAPVRTLGPKVETNSLFPDKTNVEFAHIEDKNKINLRIWERGVGETKACGTGMVATAVLSESLDKTAFPTRLQVPGGMAEAWVDKDGYACLRGPAVNVFAGEIDLEAL
ncbi:diaminopimelate epimerase [Candidatus Parcubacteria bacterium]|nr:diaminopimelate epimerase [Candidatus Parcubacteria bacterium]